MATKKKSAKRTPRKRRTPKQAPPAPLPAAAVKVEEPVAPAAEKKMKPIWYMVGLVLVSIGGLVFLTGVYYLFTPEPPRVVLGHLHPNLWWGGFMVAVGIVFILTNRKSTVG